jgi:hypothetical protein
MSERDDVAAQFREALRDAIEWVNDLDARLTRDHVTLADVEAHALEIDGAAARTHVGRRGYAYSGWPPDAKLPGLDSNQQPTD